MENSHYYALFIFSGALIIYIISYLALVNYIVWDDYKIRYDVPKSNSDVKVYRGILMGNNVVCVILLFLLGIKLYNYDHDKKIISKAAKYSVIALTILCLIYVAISLYFLDDKYSTNTVNENFSENLGFYLTIGLLVSVLIYVVLLFPMKTDKTEEEYINKIQDQKNSPPLDQVFINQGEEDEKKKQDDVNKELKRQETLREIGREGERSRRRRQEEAETSAEQKEEEFRRLQKENEELFGGMEGDEEVYQDEYEESEENIAFPESRSSFTSPDTDKQESEVTNASKNFNISFS